MIVTCKNCGTSVQLPEEPRDDARYICLNCKSVLNGTNKQVNGDSGINETVGKPRHSGEVQGKSVHPS